MLHEGKPFEMGVRFRHMRPVLVVSALEIAKQLCLYVHAPGGRNGFPAECALQGRFEMPLRIAVAAEQPLAPARDDMDVVPAPQLENLERHLSAQYPKRALQEWGRPLVPGRRP